MSVNIIRKNTIIVIFTIAICLINSIYAYGELDSKEFIPINIQKASNGSNVEINTNESNGYELAVKMSTHGLKEGYYTAYLYEQQSRDWSNYEAISFYVINECDNPIKINLNLEKSDGRVVTPSEDNGILIKKENSETIERVHISFGALELTNYFKGTIYIPFNSFKEKDKLSNNNTNEISQISSWGIVTVLNEDEEINFKASKFSLINKGSNMKKIFDSKFSIKGDNTVVIPVVGESISDYKIETIKQNGTINTDNVRFQLMQPVDGITISDNGRLVATPDVKTQEVKICAVVDNSVCEIMRIDLVKSWTLSAKEIDGTIRSIPSPDKISKSVSSKENIILNNNFILSLRLVIFLSIFAFVFLYWRWKKE